MDHYKSKSKSQTRKIFNNNQPKSLGKNFKRKIQPKKKQSNESRITLNSKQNYLIGNDIKDMVSPKTIEYSKVMEKYGDIIAENSPEEKQSTRLPNYSNITNYSFIRNEQIKSDNTTRTNKLASLPENEKSSVSVQSNKKVEMENSGYDTGKYKLQYEYCPQEANESSRVKSKQLVRENEQLKEENLNLKRMLEKEKSKSYRLEEDMKRGMNRNMANMNMNIVEVKELEQLKEKISIVEKENDELRANEKSYVSKTQEKLALFLKLCRKYAKKLKNLLYLFNKLDIGNTQQSNIMQEFTQTVDQFYQTTYHPKLIFVLLENDNTRYDLNTQRFLEELEIQSKDDHQSTSNLLTNTVENFQAQFKKMQEQNEFLVQKLEHIEGEESNEKAYLNEELNKYKRKFNDEKLHREETENSLSYAKQLNKDLENKMMILEDENATLKKNMKNANERLVSLELVKNKNINLENDLKYKESIINYLESLLKNIKVSPNLYDENKYQENYEENKFFRGKNYEDDFYTSGKISLRSPHEQEEINIDHRISFNPEKSPPFSSNDVCMSNNSVREKEKEDSFSSGKREYRIKRSSREEYRNTGNESGLKVEIDALDGEIKQLQSKLKVMIDVNKK